MTIPGKGRTVRNGYGNAHQRLRAAWAPTVALGRTVCWRCGRRIRVGQPWDLGHDDRDRRIYRGPEHRACNRGEPWRRRDRRSLQRADPPRKAPALIELFGP